MTISAPTKAPSTSQHPDQIRVGRFIFNRIETGSSSKAWRCEERGIQIIERVRELGRFWEYVAADVDSAGGQPQYLGRRGFVRTFVSPAAAAKAAITEWS